MNDKKWRIVYTTSQIEMDNQKETSVDQVGEDFPKLMLLTLIGMGSKYATSSGFLEDCGSFLQVVLSKLQDLVDGVTH